MKKIAFFVVYAIVAFITCIICGVDSIFSNPIGLLKLSILMSLIITLVTAVAVWMVELIAPQTTEKIKKMFNEE